MHKTLRTVIFDMDGLMFDTERLHFMGWQLAGKDWGIDVKEETFVKTLGKSIPAVGEVFCEAFGKDFDYVAFRKLRVKKVDDYLQTHPVPKKEGLDVLLDFLDQRGIQKALATSTKESEALDVLKKAGVYDRFAVRVYGDMVERGKPNPDIFLLAAKQAGSLPEECLVLEDSPSGVAAAKAAGMRCIMVPDMMAAGESERESTVAVCRSLLDVAEMLKTNAKCLR